jgi:colicin import membrane protein
LIQKSLRDQEITKQFFNRLLHSWRRFQDGMNTLQTPFSLFSGSETDLRRFFLFLGISFSCHLALLLIIAFTPGRFRIDRNIDRAIHVDLVSLSSVHRATQNDIHQPGKSVPQTIKQQKTKKRRTTDKPVKKTGLKRSLKKRTVKSDRVVKHAVAEVARQVKDSNNDAISSAIANIKKRVKQAGSSRIESTSGDRRRALELIEIYEKEIEYIILQNWVFSRPMAGRHAGLEVILGMKIMPDGRISETWYEKKSGSSYFDNSAFRAVMKSNPLPALPDGFNDYVVGIIFNPDKISR